MTVHDSWFTPAALILVLPPVLLDPCWHADSNVWAPLTISLDRGEDGLQPWPLVPYDRDGVIFCNPPYSNAAEWLAKCVAESKRQTAPILALVPAKAGENYWAVNVWPEAAWVAFFPWRMAFDEGGEVRQDRAGTFGNALICYGEKEEADLVWAALEQGAELYPLIRVDVSAGAERARVAAIKRKGKRK